MRRVAETCDCIELDLEELAWAAGLFDGEGTTIAKRDVRRPDRFQLQVTVPQCGRDGLPEVLVRFHRAVLGMGVIDAPNKYSMYRWRARGFVDGQAAVAMLWPFLSGVKRGQAASAFRNVAAQYRTGRFTGMQRRPRAPAVRVPHAPHGAALRRPTRLDLKRAWAAGFFDGEGWTGRVRSRQRKKGSDLVPRARIDQPERRGRRVSRCPGPIPPRGRRSWSNRTTGGDRCLQVDRRGPAGRRTGARPPAALARCSEAHPSCVGDRRIQRADPAEGRRSSLRAGTSTPAAECGEVDCAAFATPASASAAAPNVLRKALRLADSRTRRVATIHEANGVWPSPV